MDVRSVGNSQVLKETALIEALNLKAAIEVMLKNNAAAAEALADMPPRSESELDPVTLHNLALVHMGSAPGAGFKKLNYLISSGSFPPEAFANLLLLYCAPQHGFLDLAADVMAENPDLCVSLLSKVRVAGGHRGQRSGERLTAVAWRHCCFWPCPALSAFTAQDLADLLQCLIIRKQQPESALQQLDELAGRHVEGLRGLTKTIQDARLRRDNDGIRAAIQHYDDALERYIPGVRV
jgi:tetratricopeptide repeat protein 30